MKRQSRSLIACCLLSFVILYSSPVFSQNFAHGRNASQTARFPGESEKLSSKFKGKYVFMSLLLPGAGEWALGEKNLAKIFIGTDLAMLAGYFGSRAYADVLEKDFHAFAAQHAGIISRNKTEQYWIDIGNASNIYLFNERRRVQRNLEATWPETDQFYWQWDEEANRIKYVDLRSKQHRWERAATFIVGGMILNRIISMIDVVRIIRRAGAAEAQKRSFLRWQYARTPAGDEVFQLKFSAFF